MRRFRTFLLLPLLLLPLAACGVSSKPIEGRVVDAETKKPLAGAIVVARWRGTYSALVDTHTECYHVETATTDKDGRYKMAGWWEMPKGPLFSKDSMVLDAYLPGYEEYWPAGYGSTEDFKNNVLYLLPFKGTKQERLNSLPRFVGMDCGDYRDYAKKLIPLYKAVYEEAKPLAVTTEDNHVVAGIHYALDILELGFEEATKRLSKGVYEN